MDISISWYSHGQTLDNILIIQQPMHIFPKEENPFEYSNPVFKILVLGTLENNPETWYIVPNVEFIETRWITHSLGKLLGCLHVASTLPRRIDSWRPINQSKILVDSVEDLVELSLQEIP
jgi:hypothetical protein